MKVSSFHPQGKARLSHPHGEARLSGPQGTAEPPHPQGGAGPSGVRRGTVLAGGLASGGQRQRVAIARASSVDPGIILCDESFSALDEVTARALRQEFVELVRGNGKTGVVIAHSTAGRPPAGG